MKIKDAQMSAMNDTLLRSFSRETTTKLGEEFPAWMSNESRDMREQFVDSCVTHAISLDIRSRLLIYRFVWLAVRYNISIPLAPGLGQEFRRSDIHSGVKLENFFLRLLSGRDLKDEITL